MAFRNVFIHSKAFVRGLNSRIVLQKEGSEETAIPMQDINALVLDNQQIGITAYALSELAEHNVSVFVTNRSHLPVGVFLPFQNHSRQVKRIKLQLNAAESFNGRLWRALVTQKIRNQSRVLALQGYNNKSEKLSLIAESVRVHDSSNRESYAAQEYFTTLVDPSFSRRDECKLNSALNYGYSIVRGVIAKQLSAYGLLPSLGIHHKNEYNNFNLADDFIEPFRPIVDFYVLNSIVLDVFDQNPSLSSSERAKLVDVLNLNVGLLDKSFSLENAIDQVVKSYVSSLKKKSASLLVVPTVTNLKRKSYE